MLQTLTRIQRHVSIMLYFNFRRFRVNTFLARPRMRLSQERALDFGIHSALVYQTAYKELGTGILK